MDKYKRAANGARAAIEVLSLMAKVSFTLFFELPFLYLSEKALGHTPRWARLEDSPDKDVFWYNIKEAGPLRYINTCYLDGAESDEATYPIAKDFIKNTFASYHLMIKIKAEHRFCMEYQSDNALKDEENSLLYLFCDDAEPVFQQLEGQSEYSYCFEVCGFKEPVFEDSAEAAEALVNSRKYCLRIECAKQRDYIMLYINDIEISTDEMLKAMENSCKAHSRKYIFDESIKMPPDSM